MNFNGTPNVNHDHNLRAMADQLQIHTKLQNFFNVGGINGQPMLRLADNVQQMLLVRRMAWKFNRVEMGEAQSRSESRIFHFSAGIPRVQARRCNLLHFD